MPEATSDQGPFIESVTATVRHEMIQCDVTAENCGDGFVMKLKIDNVVSPDELRALASIGEVLCAHAEAMEKAIEASSL